MNCSASRGGAGRQRLQTRRSRRRHRAAARPGAVSRLRRRRMGHVPQRPIHRARHQAAQRLWQRTIPHRTDFLVKVDPALGMLGVLLEPTSVVAKAWEQIERIGDRTRSGSRKTVLVTGAGPVGLLAALLGEQRGLEMHVLDRVKDGLEARAGARSRRDLSRRRSRHAQARHRHGMHRRRPPSCSTS